MSKSKIIDINWRGATYAFEVKSTVEHFDGYMRVKFNLNPDPQVNPTGINVVTIERNAKELNLALSERGVSLLGSPVINALESWIDEYFKEWQALHKKTYD